MRWIRISMGAFLLAAAGCVVAPMEDGYRSGADETAEGCVGSCDHLYADGGWIVYLGHRHGPNCGHEFVNGKWEEKKAQGPKTAPADDR